MGSIRAAGKTGSPQSWPIAVPHNSKEVRHRVLYQRTPFRRYRRCCFSSRSHCRLTSTIGLTMS